MAEITFTEEQQKLIDKLVGDARVKARAKAKTDHAAQAAKDKETADQAALVAQKEWQKLAETHEARVKELEPFEARAKEYEEMTKDMLKKRVKALGDSAKTAVSGLPKGMTASEKLAWLNKNESLFEKPGDGVGTPAAKKKTQKKAAADVGHRPMRM